MRAALLCLLLAGCATHQPAAWQPRQAVHAQCDVTCTASCAPDEWPQWEGDPEEPTTWDNLAPVGAENRDTALRCDAARNACLRCLKTLERAGVICGIDIEC